jgi:hypothetical protein
MLLIAVYAEIVLVAIVTGYPSNDYYFFAKSKGFSINWTANPATLSSGNTIFNVRSFDIDVENPDDIELYHGIQLPDEVCLDQFQVVEVVSHPGSELSADRELQVRLGPSGFESAKALHLVSGIKLPFCFPLERPDYVGDDQTSYTFEFPETQEPRLSFPNSEQDHFWYPYDSFEIKFAAFVKYRLMREQLALTTVSDYELGSITIPDSRGWFIEQNEEIEDNSPYPFSERSILDDVDLVNALHFQRPLFERIAYPSIILTVLLFIILLAFVRSTATFIEGGVGVFFGIFTLRQVILPVGMEIRTMMEYAIGALYFVFAMALILHVTRKWRVQGLERPQPLVGSRIVKVLKTNRPRRVPVQVENYNTSNRHRIFTSPRSSSVIVLVILTCLLSALRWILRKIWEYWRK